MPEETARKYVEELEGLRRRIGALGIHVELMVAGSLRALAEHDAELARTTIQGATKVDELEAQIDELCLSLFGQKPGPVDLRFLAAVLRVVRDFKRIAEHSLNISERMLENATETAPPRNANLEWLADAVLGMLHEARDAFVSRNVPKAERVLARQGAVHVRGEALLPDLLALTRADRRAIEHAARLQSLGKSLELIADQATDIAECVVFMTADACALERAAERHRRAS